VLGTNPCPAPFPAAKSASECECPCGMLIRGAVGMTGGAGLGPAATSPCPSALYAGSVSRAILSVGNDGIFGEGGR